jgi:prepilin-type N-terminal cleavage/methylation domain-containing protein
VSPSAAPAFTLIELLVVISIVALLIALLLPAIKRAKELSKVVVCMSNTRQIGVVMKSYIADNAGFYPVPPPGEVLQHQWL